MALDQELLQGFILAVHQELLNGECTDAPKPAAEIQLRGASAGFGFREACADLREHLDPPNYPTQLLRAKRVLLKGLWGGPGTEGSALEFGVSLGFGFLLFSEERNSMESKTFKPSVVPAARGGWKALKQLYTLENMLLFLGIAFTQKVQVLPMIGL